MLKFDLKNRNGMRGVGIGSGSSDTKNRIRGDEN